MLIRTPELIPCLGSFRFSDSTAGGSGGGYPNLYSSYRLTPLKREGRKKEVNMTDILTKLAALRKRNAAKVASLDVTTELLKPERRKDLILVIWEIMDRLHHDSSLIERIRDAARPYEEVLVVDKGNGGASRLEGGILYVGSDCPLIDKVLPCSILDKVLEHAHKTRDLTAKIFG